MKTRFAILTGGGDVQPLNAVISSAKNTASALCIELVGIIKGWKGALDRNFIELAKVPVDSFIGGTILKSSRFNIDSVKNGPEIISDNFKRQNIKGIIVIGGDDTLSNSFQIKSIPQILISKTIDNDVGIVKSNNIEFKLDNIFNYFTLGFPTAAEKITSFISLEEGIRTTAYSHERIIIVESMGMHTGWLALASALGSPDFIIIPEFPLKYEAFLEKVIIKYKKQRHLIIVVAEGAKWENGKYIYSEKDENKDVRHPRFGGSSTILRDRLKKDLKTYFNTRNINAVNPAYLYRSGKPNRIDRLWADKLGKFAVELLAKGIDESFFLSIQRKKSKFKIEKSPLSTFLSMNDLHRFVDENFYDPNKFEITKFGRLYFKEIIREISYKSSYGLDRMC